MSRIEQLIGEIEEYIDGCKPQAFNNRKIIVDKDEIDELLAELRLRTPDEIKKYQKIISNQEAILSSSQEEADKILASARETAERMLYDAQKQSDDIMAEVKRRSEEMLSENEVMQQAYQRANEIIDQANTQAQELVDAAAADSMNIRQGAIAYTDDLLAGIQATLARTLNEASKNYAAFSEALSATQDVVIANRNELQGQDPAEAEEAPALPAEEGGLQADML